MRRGRETCVTRGTHEEEARGLTRMVSAVSSTAGGPRVAHVRRLSCKDGPHATSRTCCDLSGSRDCPLGESHLCEEPQLRFGTSHRPIREHWRSKAKSHPLLATRELPRQGLPSSTPCFWDPTPRVSLQSHGTRWLPSPITPPDHAESSLGPCDYGGGFARPRSPLRLCSPLAANGIHVPVTPNRGARESRVDLRIRETRHRQGTREVVLSLVLGNRRAIVVKEFKTSQ